MDVFEQSLQLHESHHGKIAMQSKVPLKNHSDLSLAYTPGVAEPCRRIAANPQDLYRYTMKSNSVAVITDGSSVLGLGDIGAAAGLPVMEGKCLLFKEFANIDAFPVCIDTRDTEEFISVVKKITVPYGGINLEDIAAPRCFEIEERLKKELTIPVFHDDQHGTAIVALAALINALKVTGRTIGACKIAMSGAGAAGTSIAKLLMKHGAANGGQGHARKDAQGHGPNIILCDRHGTIFEGREDLAGNPAKMQLAQETNPERIKGSLADAMKGADVFIGVSSGNLVTPEMVKSMAPKAIVFAMANPEPEIMPDLAKAAGAAVVGTGRSDFPNQINNVLAFPGIFRGALDIRAKAITEEMCFAAALALSACVKEPSTEKIVPDIFDAGVTEAVADAVRKCESR